MTDSNGHAVIYRVASSNVKLLFDPCIIHPVVMPDGMLA